MRRSVRFSWSTLACFSLLALPSRLPTAFWPWNATGKGLCGSTQASTVRSCSGSNWSKQAPELAGNWRWQMCLIRAYYDAYVRARQIYEQRLEGEANAILASASVRGAEAVMDDAMAVLDRAVRQPVRPELRQRVFVLCESLFHSICLQTSVEKYGASGEERGAFLDFIDTPLNNRWWLEDEFAKIRKMSSRGEKLARLELIRTWENPGEGSFYDDIGNVANSPHVRFAPEVNTDPEMIEHVTPTLLVVERRQEPGAPLLAMHHGLAGGSRL